MTAAAATAATLAVLVTPSVAQAAPTAAKAAKSCSTRWEAVQRVAVRRPGPQDGPVATMNSPVDHHLRKGQVVTSCVVAVARTESGPAYRACGADGHLWRIVRGGQVPQSCLRRV